MVCLQISGTAVRAVAALAFVAWTIGNTVFAAPLLSESLTGFDPGYSSVGGVCTQQTSTHVLPSATGSAPSTVTRYLICPRGYFSTDPVLPPPRGPSTAHTALPNTSLITPDVIGTYQATWPLYCNFNRGAFVEADVSWGPSGGTFAWHFQYCTYSGACMGTTYDNVYCGFPEGCDIGGEMAAISNYRWILVDLYWQAPATFYTGYCE